MSNWATEILAVSVAVGMLLIANYLYNTGYNSGQADAIAKQEKANALLEEQINKALDDVDIPADPSMVDCILRNLARTDGGSEDCSAL